MKYLTIFVFVFIVSSYSNEQKAISLSFHNSLWHKVDTVGSYEYYGTDSIGFNKLHLSVINNTLSFDSFIHQTMRVIDNRNKDDGITEYFDYKRLKKDVFRTQLHQYGKSFVELTYFTNRNSHIIMLSVLMDVVGNYHTRYTLIEKLLTEVEMK